MRTSIWKFPFPIDGEFTLEMPRYAKFLHVAMQGSPFSDGKPCIWALVDVDAPKVRQKFALRGTGHDCDGVCLENFVGTFFAFEDGSQVYHLFDLGIGKD